MALLALAALGVFLTAGLVAAALKLATPTSFALAVYLLAFAEIVLVTEVLSPFHGATRAGYGAAEAVLLVTAAVAWHLRGRARPPLPRLARGSARRHPVVAALAAVVTGGIGYQAFIGLTTPPGNWDSMTYHLTRVAEWLQHGGVEYFRAATERANAFQPGAEMVLLWTLIFPHRDTAAALPQLAAELAALAAVYGIARRLGHGRPAAAFAALLTGTLTEVALQSVTTQNDLTGAALLAAATYFVLGRRRHELALAGLALGLAVGVKLTAVYALPLLVALVLVRRGRRRLPEAAAFAAAGIALVGIYGYALNLAETGHALGRASETSDLRPQVTGGGTVSTIARLGWRFVDASGYHPRTTWTVGVGKVGKAIFDGLGIPVNPSGATGQQFEFPPNAGVSEDISFFGPLGILLVLPLSAVFIVALALRRTRVEKGLLALALPLYALEIALTYRYNGWLGRFLVAPVVLTMPFAAVLYTRRAAAGAAAALGAGTLALAHAYNQAKPTGLDGTQAVWSLSRTDAQTVLRPRMRDVIRGVDAAAAELPGRPLGLLAGNDDWVYPLYGPSLQRRVVVLAPKTALAEADRLDLTLVAVSDKVAPPPRDPRWQVRKLGSSGWELLVRRQQAGAT